MKNRLTALVGALIALYIGIILLVPPRMPDTSRMSVPTSSDNGKYGLLGLKRWLEQGGIPTKSLQRRYGALANDPDLSEHGNLLIMVLPQSHPVRRQERRQLSEWLAQGNNLLILSASSDRPPWSWRGDFDSHRHILADLGFKLAVEDCGCEEEVVEPDTNDRDADEKDEDDSSIFDIFKEQQRVLIPSGAHPLLKGVNRIEINGRLVPDTPPVLQSSEHRRSGLAYLVDEQDGSPALWEIRSDRSRVWISRYADLFGNISLGKKDNARLIANLISASLGDGGMVIFDDMHHGVSELYDPDAFFSDSRLHNSLWFLFALWLVYVIGRSNRLAPLPPAPDVSRASDFVRATAGLFARRLTQGAGARALFAHFFDNLRIHYGLPTNGKPVWELIAASPRVRPKDLDALRERYDRLDRRSGADLVQLVNLMHRIRRALL